MPGVTPNGKVSTGGVVVTGALLLVEIVFVVTGTDAVDVTNTVGEVTVVVVTDEVKVGLSLVVVITVGTVVGVDAMCSFELTSGNLLTGVGSLLVEAVDEVAK